MYTNERRKQITTASAKLKNSGKVVMSIFNTGESLYCEGFSLGAHGEQSEDTEMGTL